MKSAINDAQNCIVKKVIVRMNKPIVVRLAVKRFNVVLPCQTSISCGNSITPNIKLTVAITMSCQEYPSPNIDIRMS